MRIWMIALVACACSSDRDDRSPAAATTAADASHASDPIDINPRLLRRFRPVVTETAPPPVTPEKIALGRTLFYDVRLSRNHTISCNSCHPLDHYGADGQPTSPGVDGHRGTRNAPSVFNAASHFAQFWDGRAASVEEQAVMPIMNGDEMGMANEQAVVASIESVPAYVAGFAKAYPGDPRPITIAHLGEVIGAFERGLVTRSRWDEFLDGKVDALTPLERRGLRVFLDSGCMVCHTGPQVGGTMFERVGVVEPWPNQKDTGRASVTKAQQDRMVFKVPSLKNVAETAPYFHDGSAETLDAAIRMMGRHQLGIELRDPDVDAIAAWMRAMTGPIDRAYVAATAKL
jgi:cytochrome c peroxidase